MVYSILLYIIRIILHPNYYNFCISILYSILYTIIVTIIVIPGIP